jgi:T5SS/PEP-CTERM-associated repeat protein
MISWSALCVNAAARRCGILLLLCVSLLSAHGDILSIENRHRFFIIGSAPRAGTSGQNYSEDRSFRTDGFDAVGPINLMGSNAIFSSESEGRLDYLVSQTSLGISGSVRAKVTSTQEDFLVTDARFGGAVATVGFGFVLRNYDYNYGFTFDVAGTASRPPTGNEDGEGELEFDDFYIGRSAQFGATNEGSSSGILSPGDYSGIIIASVSAGPTGIMEGRASFSLNVTPILTNETFWLGEAGTAFGSSANWDILGVPTSGTIAVFNASGGQTSYAVTLGPGATSQRVRIADSRFGGSFTSSDVTFQNGTYAVSGGSASEPSLAVERFNSLTLADAEVRAQHVRLTGTLVARAGGRLIPADNAGGSIVLGGNPATTSSVFAEPGSRIATDDLSILAGGQLRGDGAIFVGDLGALGASAEGVLVAAPTLTLAENGFAVAHSIFSGANGDLLSPGGIFVGPDAEATNAQLRVRSGVAFGEGSQIETGAAVLDGTEADPAIAIVGGAQTLWHIRDRVAPGHVEAGSMVIGAAGSGLLKVQDGGHLLVDGELLVADQAGSEGTIELTGVGTLMRAPKAPFTLGKEGPGELIVSNGATLESRHSILGGIPDGSGRATLTGGTWRITQAADGSGTDGLILGFHSAGHLMVGAGGKLESAFGILAAADPDATAVLAVEGGEITTPGALTIGADGTAVAAIGANSTVSASELILGLRAESNGDFRLSGTGARLVLQNVGSITVGRDGEGTLLVEEFGRVEFEDAGLPVVQVGAGTGRGTVTIGEAGFLTAPADSVLTLGSSQGGRGVLEIGVLGSASFGSGQIGTQPLAAASAPRLGSIQMTGGGLDFVDTAGSAEADIAGNIGLYVGGRGELRIDGEGLLKTKTVVLTGNGSDEGEHAGAVVSGEAASWETAALVLGGDQFPTAVLKDQAQLEASRLDVGGNGRIIASEGAILDTSGGPARVGGTVLGAPATNAFVGLSGAGTSWFGSTVSIGDPSGAGSGAVLITDGASLVATAVTVHDGGTLFGSSGVVSASLSVEAGGAIEPGSSPGILTIDGDVRFELGSLLVIEIAGGDAGTEYDRLRILGDAELGGTVVFRFIDGFAPRAGNRFDFLKVSGATASAFDEVTFENLAPDFQFETTSAPDGTQTFVAKNDGVFVPEPSSGLLILICGAALLGLARSQHRSN